MERVRELNSFVHVEASELEHVLQHDTLKQFTIVVATAQTRETLVCFDAKARADLQSCD